MKLGVVLPASASKSFIAAANSSAEVTITDLGGGSTQNPTVTGGDAELTPVTSDPDAENTIPGSIHLYGHFSERNNLNGMWNLDELLRGRHGLHLLDFTFEEASGAASTRAKVWPGSRSILVTWATG